MSSQITTSEICRFRGDTQPVVLSVKDRANVVLDSGTAGQITSVRDVTNDTYVLTVDSVENPADNTTQVFQVSGVIIDGPNGQVEFQITSTEADIPAATYFYSIRQTVAGNTTTVAKGAYIIQENIGE